MREDKSKSPMKPFIRFISEKTLKSFLENYYLKKRQLFKFKNTNFFVDPNVFHPGLFFSSKFMGNFICTLPLNNKTVLDIGCGSGILSITAATRGAKVTGIDINPTAINNAGMNAELNNVSIEVLLSDLFANIGKSTYDYIFINPPYYPKMPTDHSSYAWYCGENHEYFNHLFKGIREYIHNDSAIYMVLSDCCDVEKIEELARENNFSLDKELTRNLYIEEIVIYRCNTI